MEYDVLYSPIQYQLINPLAKWKVLSLDNLHRLSGNQKKNSNFYKTISALEKKGLVQGIQDPYSKQKYVYLSAKGERAVGYKSLVPVNSENLIHDSFVSEVAITLKELSMVDDVLLEHEILERYPLVGHRPDALIVGKLRQKFQMAMEMELTVKAKQRILDTFQFYSQSDFFNNVLYVFGNSKAFEIYVRNFEEKGSSLKKDKFLFVIMKNLYRRWQELFSSDCYSNGKITTLGKLFGVEAKVGFT